VNEKCERTTTIAAAAAMAGIQKKARHEKKDE